MNGNFSPFRLSGLVDLTPWDFPLGNLSLERTWTSKLEKSPKCITFFRDLVFRKIFCHLLCHFFGGVIGDVSKKPQT